MTDDPSRRRSVRRAVKRRRSGFLNSDAEIAKVVQVSSDDEDDVERDLTDYLDSDYDTPPPPRKTRRLDKKGKKAASPLPLGPARSSSRGAGSSAPPPAPAAPPARSASRGAGSGAPPPAAPAPAPAPAVPARSASRVVPADHDSDAADDDDDKKEDLLNPWAPSNATTFHVSELKQGETITIPWTMRVTSVRPAEGKFTAQIMRGGDHNLDWTFTTPLDGNMFGATASLVKHAPVKVTLTKMAEIFASIPPQDVFTVTFQPVTAGKPPRTMVAKMLQASNVLGSSLVDEMQPDKPPGTKCPRTVYHRQLISLKIRGLHYVLKSAPRNR